MLTFVYQEGRSSHYVVSLLEHQDLPFNDSATKSGLLICNVNIVPYYCSAPSFLFL